MVWRSPTQSIALRLKAKSQTCRCGSSTLKSPRASTNMIKFSIKKKSIFFVLLLSLMACADGANEPTPEAAKRFLKLRGYDFDQQSFFRAAAAGDVIAVNGFLSTGMNANVKDENGDTVLTASAARGDLQMVNVLI